jgi:hypothetical protein
MLLLGARQKATNRFGLKAGQRLRISDNFIREKLEVDEAM